MHKKYSNIHESVDDAYDESGCRTLLTFNLTILLANVFSAKSIKEANPSLRMAMEDVAGKAERLAKERSQKDPPPPFRKRVTPSLYSRVYSTDGREAQDKRAQQ